ncbi:MAG: HU family DNA-binding protein [Carbonactinosporaceae bacterium]
MNKAQLIDALADQLGGKRAASDAVDAMLVTIQRAVAKGDRVAITGFGVFEKIDRPARTARNPATGERIRVKKTAVPKFKPGQGFKDVVSGAKKPPRLTAASTTRPVAKKTTTTSAGRQTTVRRAPAKRAVKR